MARPSCNRLNSVQSIHVYEWIKANWEKQVVANKWTSEATAKRITGDLGFLCTEGNLRTVLDEFFPKYNFMHAAHNPTNPIHRLKHKADKFDELDTWMAGLAEDLGKHHNMIKNLDNRLLGLSGYTDSLNKRLHSICSSFESLNTLVDGLSDRISAIEKRMPS